MINVELKGGVIKEFDNGMKSQNQSEWACIRLFVPRAWTM